MRLVKRFFGMLMLIGGGTGGVPAIGEVITTENGEEIQTETAEDIYTET